MPIDNERNHRNYILFIPDRGKHTGKPFLYIESNRRFLKLRNYVKKRPIEYKDMHYYLAMNNTDTSENDKWHFGHYSNQKSTEKITVPGIIYDIKNDKVYTYKAPLWEIK